MRERFCLLALCGVAWLAGPVGAEPPYEWQWTIAPGILPSNQTPAIVALPDGALLACWVGKTCVLRSEHDQAGDRWSTPEAPALPNSKSAVDAVSTGGGGVLLASSDSPTQRTPLNLAYSPDLRLSYPALIRAADGMYHLVYRAQESCAPAAITHVMFNHEWLMLRLRSAGIR